MFLVYDITGDFIAMQPQCESGSMTQRSSQNAGLRAKLALLTNFIHLFEGNCMFFFLHRLNMKVASLLIPMFLHLGIARFPFGCDWLIYSQVLEISMVPPSGGLDIRESWVKRTAMFRLDGPTERNMCFFVHSANWRDRNFICSWPCSTHFEICPCFWLCGKKSMWRDLSLVWSLCQWDKAGVMACEMDRSGSMFRRIGFELDK